LFGVYAAVIVHFEGLGDPVVGPPGELLDVAEIRPSLPEFRLMIFSGRISGS
jgi:hypothetical protein